MAKTFSRRKTATPFIGLLTRGEEVGFVGAIGHFELGWLTKRKRELICISLEASRTLPSAEIGKGPVVRLGDRRTVFNADALKILSDVAEKLLPGKHQKRIMDGGSCEATAATIYGLTTIGITLPLGNYHNQGLEGGPDCRGQAGPAPEFIHIDDLDAELKLCLGLMKPGLAWTDPWKKQQQALINNLKKYKRFIKSSL
jgi:endoglucanase